MTATFAVIIPTYGEFPYVFKCLETLARFTSDYHCYVIDDCSPEWDADVEAEIRRIIPSDRLTVEHYPENRGLTSAWNDGLALAASHQHPYTALVNSDTLFTPGWAMRTIRALGRADLVGPLTNAPSLSYHQDIRKHTASYRLDDSHDALVDLSASLKRRFNNRQSKGTINGFWMAAKTDVWWANAYDVRHVFNPANRLTNNENEFQKRFKGQITAMLDVFIFHYRSVSRGLANVNPDFCKGHFRLPENSSTTRLNPSYVSRRGDLVRFIPRDVKRLLDVGCSVGAVGSALKERQPMEVVGIEYDPRLAAIAAANLDGVLCQSAQNFPLALLHPYGSFDALLFADVLEHLEDPQGVVANFTQVLQPGGRVIISLPNVGHCSVIWNLLWKGYWPHRDRGIHDRTHLRWFTKRNIEELLEFANLEPVEWRESHRIADAPGDWNSKLGNVFARGPLRRLLTYQYFVLARKV